MYFQQVALVCQFLEFRSQTPKCNQTTIYLTFMIINLGTARVSPKSELL